MRGGVRGGGTQRSIGACRHPPTRRFAPPSPRGGGAVGVALGRFPVFAVAGEGAGFVFDVGLAGEGVVGDGELGLAQALDLVAQAGGGFELKIGGGVFHLAFEGGDVGL